MIIYLPSVSERSPVPAVEHRTSRRRPLRPAWCSRTGSGTGSYRAPEPTGHIISGVYIYFTFRSFHPPPRKAKQFFLELQIFEFLTLKDAFFKPFFSFSFSLLFNFFHHTKSKKKGLFIRSLFNSFLFMMKTSILTGYPAIQPDIWHNPR